MIQEQMKTSKNMSSTYFKKELVLLRHIFPVLEFLNFWRCASCVSHEQFLIKTILVPQVKNARSGVARPISPTALKTVTLQEKITINGHCKTVSIYSSLKTRDVGVA